MEEVINPKYRSLSEENTQYVGKTNEFYVRFLSEVKRQIALIEVCIVSCAIG